MRLFLIVVSQGWCLAESLGTTLVDLHSNLQLSSCLGHESSTFAVDFEGGMAEVFLQMGGDLAEEGARREGPRC